MRAGKRQIVRRPLASAVQPGPLPQCRRIHQKKQRIVLGDADRSGPALRARHAGDQRRSGYLVLFEFAEPPVGKLIGRAWCLPAKPV